MGQGIADVVHAGEVHDHALEAHAVAGVAAGAVLAQVAVPPVVLRGHAQLFDAGLQHLQPSSPILSHYDVAIVLNQPSLDKFEPKIKPGGILIYDGYGVMNPPQRKDITIYRIDAMDKAAEMKNSKVFNMIVLGGLLKVCPVVSTDGLNKALYKSLPERHHGLIPLNMQAVEEGMKIIEKVD